MNVADTVAAIRGDIDQIEDMARWAFADGWTPQAPNHDTTSKPIPVEVRDAQRIGLADPDNVPGLRRDVGLGDAHARSAYRSSAEEIRQAHGLLICAALAAGQRRQPAVKPCPPNSRPELGEMRTALAAIRTLLSLLDGATFDDLGLGRRLMTRARNHTDTAWRHLAAHMQRGAADPLTQAVGEEMCRICDIRPKAEYSGGRCNTCKTWFYRNKQERPKSLDGVNSAKAARTRRLRRGEGWGDESLSCAAVRPRP